MKQQGREFKNIKSQNYLELNGLFGEINTKNQHIITFSKKI